MFEFCVLCGYRVCFVVSSMPILGGDSCLGNVQKVEEEVLRMSCNLGVMAYLCGEIRFLGEIVFLAMTSLYLEKFLLAHLRGSVRTEKMFFHPTGESMRKNWGLIRVSRICS